MERHPSSAGFTLIELLVVIAIIAVLSVVVVLSLNPAELLRQSRDANRLSDLSTLNSALALYTTDQAGVSGFSLGNASSVYVSLPDSSSTCGTWSLPALPSGYTYACSTSTSSKNINNTGWIPVSFSSISGGAPFSNLPLDGVNQSSTGLYYTYYTNGSQFMVTAIPESQKQKTALAVNTPITSYPDVMANGSNMTISPLFSTSGLVGWWPLNEGAGTTVYDQSGNNHNGNWSGNYINGSHYAGGKVGAYAGNFDGSTNYITVSSQGIINGNQFTFTAWANKAGNGDGNGGGAGSSVRGMLISQNNTWIDVCNTDWSPNNAPTFEIVMANTSGAAHTPPCPATGIWQQYTGTYDGTAVRLYLNGNQIATFASSTLSLVNNGSVVISGWGNSPAAFNFNGLINDVRIYNRALSPAEIQAIYNAER